MQPTSFSGGVVLGGKSPVMALKGDGDGAIASADGDSGSGDGSGDGVGATAALAPAPAPTPTWSSTSSSPTLPSEPSAGGIANGSAPSTSGSGVPDDRRREPLSLLDGLDVLDVLDALERRRVRVPATFAPGFPIAAPTRTHAHTQTTQ